MERPGNMQVTLVSYYGEKTGRILEYIQLCQDQLSTGLLSAFQPYALEQVHGTIIGLEGCRVGEWVKNENFSTYRAVERWMSPKKLLQFLRSGEFPALMVRVGGFQLGKDWGFTSRGQHPYQRSFSIQGSIAVAMGWVIENNTFPDTLDQLRRHFNRLNVLHKWHRHEADQDNDFYFVLGRVDRRKTSDRQIQWVEGSMRQFLAEMTHITFPINREVLSIVGYLDPQLPLQTSCSFKLDDEHLQPDQLLRLYPVCAS